MAQANITCFADISGKEAELLVLAIRNAVAWEIHGLKEPEIRPDSVSVLFSAASALSLSGAEVEAHILVSGNDWPRDRAGKPLDAAGAKTHFDAAAASIYTAIRGQSRRKIYVWVTPFVASGWAE